MKKFLITAAVIMSTTTANAMSVEEVVSSKVLTYDVLSTTCKMLKKKSRYTKEEVVQLKAFATENKICGYKPKVTVVDTVVSGTKQADDSNTIASLKAIIESKDLVISQLREKIAKLEGSTKNKPEEDTVSFSKWIVTSDTNPLDDSKTVVSHLESISGTNTWGKKIYFIARCQSNTTEVYINWGAYLGSDGSMVKVRIGNGKTLNQYMSHSTTDKATFVSQPIKMLRNIVNDNTNKLVLQTVPYSDSPITAVFDTTGAKESLATLAKTCNWKFK